MREVTFAVGGMKGENCIQRIEQALSQMKGVDRALADLNNEMVKVEYEEGQVNIPAIHKTIEEVGYQVNE
ncbi:heavy-metal-associated domain-containing protein [Pseudalkalibacillus caeni]|uniref:Heavy-metal-associated domain-containing protein n=1 Tax=Exobacillus caeni TaxID=2574798 RepID=A0A5R9EWU6_9BACL|nr:heavy metal-associated domain-containing protein [Pseudalkalibacillus caeni]TLS35079.1 heavy-metal-associated domain-containing protein [Pseudalkalibacillus caeni]